MNKTETGLIKVDQQELETLIVKLYKDKTKKGLLVLGPVGVGKSTIMRKHLGNGTNSYDIQNVTDPANYQLEIRSNLQSGVCETQVVVSNQESQYPRQDIYPIGVYIDDLGTDRSINRYGNIIDPIEFAIQHLYNKEIRLWANTNLNLEELTNKYGPRIVSRLKEMCYVVVLEGPDYRDQLDNDTKEIQEILK